MIKDLSDAQKLDILLALKKKGYNLQDTDDPAVMQMSLGTGYTLFASIRDSWVIEFNDGVEKTRHNIDSVKIPFTNAKDAQNLFKEYNAECKRVLAEKRGEPVPEQKEPEADLKEKRRILEALENGEIKKPASRKRDLSKVPGEAPVEPTPQISNPKTASQKEEQQKKPEPVKEDETPTSEAVEEPEYKSGAVTDAPEIDPSHVQIIKNVGQDKVEVTKNTKGYNWVIVSYSDNMNEAIDKAIAADMRLRAQFGSDV